MGGKEVRIQARKKAGASNEGRLIKFDCETTKTEGFRSDGDAV